MPRRARSALSAGLLLPVAAVLLLLLGGGYFGMRILTKDRRDPASFHGVTQLDVNQYLENGNSLRGNTYQITGVVENQLKWTATGGRILSVQIQGNPLPVRIPADIANESIQKGEEYRFKVQVEQDGLLVAKTLEKI